MKNKYAFLLFLLLPFFSMAQNVGIGTNTPVAKLHVNGDLRLQNGDAVNKFSRDSLFSENSHNNIPTEKAIKDYMQKGMWGTADFNDPGPNAPFPRDSVMGNLEDPRSIFVLGNFVYVADASYGPGLPTRGLSVYDISNPDNITVRGSTVQNLTGANAVFVKGNYAYVVSYLGNRLCIFDISNPGNIVAKDFTGTNLFRPNAVFAKDNYAYVTSNIGNSLSIFDITNPDAIVARGTITTNLSQPGSVYVEGNYAYVTSRANNRLCVFDISNPDVIAAMGFTTTNLNDPAAVCVQGNFAYVISENECGCPAGTGSSLSIFDISNPAATVHKTTSRQNMDYPLSLSVQGKYAYVLSGGYGVSAFDLDMDKQVILSETGLSAVSPSRLWQQSGANIMRTTGNVGIGTSAPLQKLHVEGNSFVSGFVGIGTNTLDAPLAFENVTGQKLSLYSAGVNNQYGLGVQGSLLQLYTPYGIDNIGFGYGGSDAFNERARIINSGADGMQVNGRVILRNGTTDINSGPGVWLNNPTNTALMGFIGTQNSSNIGFYGGPAGWGLTYNTTNSHVGIGNQNPTRPLSFPATLGEKILLYPGGLGEVGIGVYGNELRIHSDYAAAKISFGYQDNAGNFTERMWLNNSTGVLTVNGTAYPSDRRFKKQISNIQHPLQKILSLNGVEYYMRNSEFPQMHFTTEKQVGLLAQEVEKVLPEAVKVINADGYKGVDYAKLIPLLIEGMKEQQQQIDKLKKQVEELTKK